MGGGVGVCVHAPGIWWVEAKDAAGHLTMPGIAPTAKNYWPHMWVGPRFSNLVPSLVLLVTPLVFSAHYLIPKVLILENLA